MTRRDAERSEIGLRERALSMTMRPIEENLRKAL